MRAFGRRLLLALGLLLAGCGEDAADRLSSDEAVAYAVLLQEFQRIIGTDEQLPPVNLCVEVSLPHDGKVRDMAGLLQKLRADLPADWSITLVPMEQCSRFSEFGQYRLPNGERAQVFFASADVPEDDNSNPTGEQVWHAGFVCGPLCGSGGTYLFRFEDGRPTLAYTSDWVS
jgi:hypothetical protein